MNYPSEQAWGYLKIRLEKQRIAENLVISNVQMSDRQFAVLIKLSYKKIYQ